MANYRLGLWLGCVGVLGCASIVCAVEPQWRDLEFRQEGEKIRVRTTFFRGVDMNHPYFSQIYETINKVYYLPLSGSFERTEIQKQLEALYDLGFFESISITLEPTKVADEYILAYDCVIKPAINRVEVLGATLPPLELLESLFADLPKDLSIYKEIDKRLVFLTDWYRERGYTLAEIRDKSIVNGTLFVTVFEGKILDIDFQFFNAKGERVNGRTKVEVLLRDLSIVPGRIYQEFLFQRDQQFLESLGVFDSVRFELVPTKGNEEQGFVLRYLLVERRSRNFNLSGNFAFGSEVGVGFSYTDKNLSGSLDSFSVLANYFGGDNISVSLRYNNPSLGLDGNWRRLGFSLSGFYGFTSINAFRGGRFRVPTSQGGEPITQRWEMDISFPFRLGTSWLVIPELSFKRITVLSSSTGRPVTRDILGNSLTSSGSATDVLGMIGVRFLRDKRNSDFVATAGSLLDFTFQQTLGFSGINFGRFLIDAAYYLPTPWLQFRGRSAALALGGSLGLTYGNLPPYEAFVLGGERTVRGYSFGDIASSRHYLLGSLEYRIPLPLNLYAAAFVDVASDLGSQASVPGNPGGVRGKSGFGLGYGIGLRFLNQRVSVDYVFNNKGNSGISFSASLRF